MTTLNRLIEELCPNGVEYVALKIVADVGTGSSDRINQDENGAYPFYVRSQTVLKSNQFLFDEEAIIIPGEGGIGDIFHYVNGKYDLHQRAYRIHFTDSRVNTKFAYYYLFANFKKFITMKAVVATVTSIRKPMIEDFLLPIPPLPVQSEIVRILDNFAELTAELTAELRSRKKQYEYYRNSLLALPDALRVAVGEMSLSTSTGVTPLAGNSEYYDGGEIPWLRTQEVRFVDIWETEMKVTEKAFKETSLKWVPADCVIVAISGATAGRVGINKIPLTTNQHCCCFEIDKRKAMYRYVFHCLSNANEDLLRLKQGARGDLNAGLIKRFTIPLPSLEEQARIVEILDKFDALTTDITKGLPAEIAARQKQYEYYRDKLLTF